jgi:hypothetical protein
VEEVIMKRDAYLRALIFGLILAAFQNTTVLAAEVKIFTSRAIATVLEVIGPEFERTTGNKLNVISGFGPVFVRQINAGSLLTSLQARPP